MKENIICKTRGFCPYCDKSHDLELRLVFEKVLVMDGLISAYLIRYYCPITKMHFENGYLLDFNLSILEREAKLLLYENEKKLG